MIQVLKPWKFNEDVVSVADEVIGDELKVKKLFSHHTAVLLMTSCPVVSGLCPPQGFES